MVKAIAISVVVIFLIGGSAYGQDGAISHVIDFEALLGGTISVTDGPGSASLLQNVLLSENQTATSVGTAATQSTVGSLSQAGSAGGLFAGLTVDQALAVGGINTPALLGNGQVQAVGGALGTVAQGQGVGLIGTQSLLNGNTGPGAASADQNTTMGLEQAASNVMGQGVEGASLEATQHSDIAGGPGSLGVVSTTMTAGTAQTQTVN